MPERFDKFTERARKVLDLARRQAVGLGHPAVDTEHILLGLLAEGEGVAAKALTNLGVDLNTARSAVEFIIGRGDRTVAGDIGLTPRAKKVIELSVDEARRLNHHYIGTEHLLLGLVREGEGIAAGVLESLGVSLDKVRSQVIYVLNQSAAYHSGAADGPAGGGRPGHWYWHGATPDRHAPWVADLSTLVQAGSPRPVVGRDLEIARLTEVLARRNRHHALLVAQPGADEASVVVGLAQRIWDGRAPEGFPVARVLLVDLDELTRSAAYYTDAEYRLRSLVIDAERAGSRALFIPAIDRLLGGPGTAESLLGANVLAPVLARDTLRIVGAMTPERYHRLLTTRQAALGGNFAAIVVGEPPIERAAETLRAARERYEAHHQVRTTDEVMARAADIAARHPLDMVLPGGAVDLLDTAARAAVGRAMPAELRQLEAQAQQAREEKEQFILLQRYEEAAARRDREAALLAQAGALREAWSRQIGSDRVPVDSADVVGALEARGVEPLPSVVPTLAEHRARTEAAIAARTGGAPRARSGNDDLRRPVVMLVLGEAVRSADDIGIQLARELFGEGATPLVVDLSAFADAGAAGRLLGVPPGREDFEAGGLLSDAIWRRPERVVLLHAVDRAHPAVHAKLREVVRVGRIQDGRGRSIDFRYAVLLLASRLPTREAVEKRMGPLPEVGWVVAGLAEATGPSGG